MARDSVGISLAHKCQLLFGAAVILILFAALLAPWLRVGAIIDESELGATREIARLWEETDPGAIKPEDFVGPVPPGAAEPSRVCVRRLIVDELGEAPPEDEFARTALEHFRNDDQAGELSEALWEGNDRVYRYAAAVRDDSGALQTVVVAERRSPRAAGQLFTNRLYLLTAGLLAGALAVLVFYLITTRLILSPVRSLRDTAERIRGGEHDVRAQIRTGDEFEELADAFNDMLSSLEQQREQLRAANRSLDSRVTKLEEANVALHEAAKLKGDFLAGVSHELRTPLNSIIGFAELLQQVAEREQSADNGERDTDQIAKRQRYLANIVAAGRSLLDMINDLLNMAKIEAGKMDLHVESVSLAEACEALLALIRPQAERKSINLRLELGAESGGRASDQSAPIIETDPRKFQQIIFNFLSNAVKFTPQGGEVTLRTERLVGGDAEPRVRVSVLDTGPGIAPQDQERIFEKFIQLESGHTRMHAGTGLGLAICRELSGMIQGEIQLVSEPGRGSMFSLILPMRMDPDRAAEMTLRLAGRRSDGREQSLSLEALQQTGSAESG